MRGLIEDQNDVISEKAYLYSTWTGKLKVMEGKIMRVDGCGYGTFCNEDTEKIITCHLEPGKIYNAIVWLSERNDELAISLLVKYHKEKIEELKEKMEGHLQKISSIKDGVEYKKEEETK